MNNFDTVMKASADALHVNKTKHRTLSISHLKKSKARKEPAKSFFEIEN